MKRDADLGRAVRVFKGSRATETYIYVDMDKGIAVIPDELMQRFGEPIEVLSLHLTRNRTLANADAAVVLQALESQGFYLQLPPRAEEWQR